MEMILINLLSYLIVLANINKQNIIPNASDKYKTANIIIVAIICIKQIQIPFINPYKLIHEINGYNKKTNVSIDTIIIKYLLFSLYINNKQNPLTNASA